MCLIQKVEFTQAPLCKAACEGKRGFSGGFFGYPEKAIAGHHEKSIKSRIHLSRRIATRTISPCFSFGSLLFKVPDDSFFNFATSPTTLRTL